MIPTAVIVNDNNPTLAKIADQLKTKLRVIKRSSLDGERLYSGSTPFFEGVLYFDELGQKQLSRQDSYEDIIKAIDEKLKLLKPTDHAYLQKYLILQSAQNDKR